MAKKIENLEYVENGMYDWCDIIWWMESTSERYETVKKEIEGTECQGIGYKIYTSVDASDWEYCRRTKSFNHILISVLFDDENNISDELAKQVQAEIGKIYHDLSEKFEATEYPQDYWGEEEMDKNVLGSQ